MSNVTATIDFWVKILYFYQYFSTSEGAWGTRVYEFAKRWVAQGHEVTVVSSVYAKSDLKARGLVSDQEVEGIRLKVISVLIDNRQSVFRRIWTFLQYAVISSWYALTLKTDVVIASSGPITVGIPGLVARWLRGRTLVFEARDLWPEGAVKMELLKNPFIIRLAYLFERWCYQSANVILGLSPGIQRNIQSRFPSSRVESVTNAANLELFTTRLLPPPDLEAGTYAIYFGNIGEVNHSDYLLDAAALLMKRGRNDITFLMIGEGQRKALLKERVQHEGLRHVVFLDLMPKSKLVAYIQHALVSVIPLKPLPVFDTSSPNKLFESMAGGVPVIQTTQGWIKDFIAEHQVGFTVDGNNPETLAEQLIVLRDNAQLGKEMGNRGREIAKRFFDKDILADKMLGILELAVARKK